MKYSGKKLLLSILIPALAFTAMTGTGFGLWVFGGNTSDSTLPSQELEIAIYFTQFEVSMDGTLSIDETGTSFDSCSIVLDTKFDVIKGVLGIDGTRAIKQIDIHYTVTCVMDKTLSEYIYCKKVNDITKTGDRDTNKTSYPNATDTSPYFKITSSKIDDGTKKDANNNYVGIDGETDLKQSFPVLFDWQSGMRPKSTNQYTTMMNKVNSINYDEPITFIVNLEGSDSTVTYYE